MKKLLRTRDQRVGALLFTPLAIGLTIATITDPLQTLMTILIGLGVMAAILVFFVICWLIGEWIGRGDYK